MTAQYYHQTQDNLRKKLMDFPNIKDAPIMAIDLETYDPELLDNGPGWGRGKGYIVGIAVAIPGKSWYFPIRHQGDPGNLPVETVLAWAKEAFSGSGDKVFANANYDLGWLKWEGVEVNGFVCDVQLAEPLIDEYARSYSLNSLAAKYLGESKVEVQDDYELIAFDCVSNPSTQGAFLKPINESINRNTTVNKYEKINNLIIDIISEIK